MAQFEGRAGLQHQRFSFPECLRPDGRSQTSSWYRENCVRTIWIIRFNSSRQSNKRRCPR